MPCEAWLEPPLPGDRQSHQMYIVFACGCRAFHSSSFTHWQPSYNYPPCPRHDPQASGAAVLRQMVRQQQERR